MQDVAGYVERDELYARNWAFIAPSLQKDLANTRLLFAGTGLGSMIARATAQTGFQRFILADGDVVERPNLNRQDFTGQQLGRNKADAMAETLRSMQPRADIEVVPRYLTAEDFPSLVARSDIVVNTIDLDNPAFLALNRVAHAQGKYCLFPMNLGWGGSLLVFSPFGMTLDEYLAQDHPELDPEAAVSYLIERVIQSVPGGVPQEIAHVLRQFVDRTPETWPYDPQLGIAAHLTAAISARAAVALVAGQPVREAPDAIWVNASDAIAPLTTPTGSHSERHATIGDTGGGKPPRHTPLPTTRPFSRENVERRIEALARSEHAGGSAHAPVGEYVAVFRPGTRLTIISASHNALTEQERADVSAYRLEQYIAAGLYDAELVERAQIKEDPAMTMLGPRDTHLIVVNEDGVIASYMCLQAAAEQFRPRITEASALSPFARESFLRSKQFSGGVRAASSLGVSVYPTVSEAVRRGFPVETEYGALYVNHAGLRNMPVDNVREIARFVRNLSMKRHGSDSTIDLAIVETILASVRYLLAPDHHAEAVVGCIAPEARRFLYHLGIPVAYAPSAPILGENLGGSTPDGPPIWADASHAPGKFWPFAISCLDLKRDQAYFEQLETTMACDSAQEVRRAMNEARRSRLRPRSRFASYTEPTERLEWVDMES